MSERTHSSARGAWPEERKPWQAARSWHALLALFSVSAGAALAWQHPLSGAWCTALFIAAVTACARWPSAWLTALPALLPICGLAPWTGWLTFEEWDLLVLAAAGGGYARLAASRAANPSAAHHRHALLAGLFTCLFAGALILSTWRGLNAAGGFTFDLFQGYREPLNSIRLAKSCLAACLLFPLWTAAARREPVQAGLRLADGLVLGLLGTALACAWERAAFTDLLNFSTDYRTTALFWEMHVGGAALDGILALCFPFMVAALLQGQPRWRWAAAAACAAPAAYAALTTFSRGVYLAVPLGAVVTWVMHSRQVHVTVRAQPSPGWPAMATGCALVLAFATAAFWMFPSSGYRGMLALLACALAVTGLAGALRKLPGRMWAIGLLGGACLAAMAAGTWLVSGRLVYAAFGLLALTAAGGWTLHARSLAGARPGQVDLRSQGPGRVLGLAALVAMLPCMAWVARHWGGEVAGAAVWPVAALLALALLAGSMSPDRWWPARPRWLAVTGLGMCVAALVVAAFLAGGYMQDRFSTSRGDFSGRVTHWRQGLASLVSVSDWLLGRGTGRFVDERAFAAPDNDRPGDYRLAAEQDQHHLRLVAGTHTLGWGEVQRISQRMAAPSGSPVLRLRVRSDAAVKLHFDICFKHLLYDGGCLVKQLNLPASPGLWQTAVVSFDGSLSNDRAIWPPRFVMFSVASEVPGMRVDVDDLDLRDGHGQELLSNGGFEQGLAHWFMSSDRYHMPWHMKNMALHVLFEQGAAGLLLLTCLCGGALVRTTVGPARQHPLAPAVAGGLAGFLAVGLFDSLLDVPRVAFLFYFLVLLGLTLRTAPKVHAAEQQHPDPGNP